MLPEIVRKRMIKFAVLFFSIGIATTSIAQTAATNIPLYCPDCISVNSHENAAYYRITNEPNANVPANQQYDYEVYVYSDVQNQLIKIKYVTMSMQEGPFTFYSPIKQSTEIFSLDSDGPDQIYLALQIALLAKRGEDVIMEDVTLSDPAHSFGFGRGEDTMIELRQGVDVQVNNALSNALNIGVFAKLKRLWKDASNLFGNGTFRIVTKFIAQDGTFVWAHSTGLTQSLEPIAYFNADGSVRAVIDPDMMQEIEGEPAVDDWLEDNQNEIDGQPISSNDSAFDWWLGENGDPGRLGDIQPASVPSPARRFLECYAIYQNQYTRVTCRWKYVT